MQRELAALRSRRDRLAELSAQVRLRNIGQFPTPGVLAANIDPRIVRTPMLDLLDNLLVDVAEHRLDRLIFNCAPQEGKSQRISRTFPLWLLLRNPNARIAVASYEHTIARRWGKQIRNDITGRPDLGLKVRFDTSAAHEWQLDGHDGGVISVGIGGALTGRPVDGALIIDDPLKGRAEADSVAYRTECIEWWQETASTRLAPGTPVVLLMTRWHEDDLAGWLARTDPSWTVINIPTLADHDPNLGQVDPLGRLPGEYLESARGRNEQDWLRIRKQVGERGWQALYQGRPTPPAGGLFKRNWWQVYDTPRFIEDGGRCVPLALDTLVASWDCTFKDTNGSDYVVGQVWGKKGTEVFLLDQVRGRWDFTETARQVELLHHRWPTATVLIEDKANGPAVISHLRSRVPGMVPITPKDSKQARASAVAPFVEAGNVHIPSPQLAPWVDEWLEEVSAFPLGAHDDQVDAATQALNRLLIGFSAGASFMDELVRARR